MAFTQRNILIAVIILVGAAAGAAAIIHNSNSSSPTPLPVAATDSGVNGPAAQPYAAEYTAPPSANDGDGYYPLIARPAYIRQQQAPYPAVEEQPAEPADAGPTYSAARPVYREYRERHHGRSKKHSVEIVAGTAAAGAAIGAIAGGGKGAALGGISGAGAGFIYDRLTHNR